VKKDKTGKKKKEFGINRNSILNELKYFHVCNGCLIPDVMHDLLEGALQYEVKLLLQVMIQNKAFTLDLFNTRLKNVELGYMESSKRPTLVALTTLNGDGNSLKQNGINDVIHVGQGLLNIILF